MGLLWDVGLNVRLGSDRAWHQDENLLGIWWVLWATEPSQETQLHGERGGKEWTMAFPHVLGLLEAPWII